MIKIIGEEHGESPLDKEFRKDAKQLARNGTVILVRENKVFDAHKNGLMEENIYAIEDKVIWEYFGIIQALSEIYPLIRTEKESGLSLLDLYEGTSKTDPNYVDIKEAVAKPLTEYTESYCCFLREAAESNRVSKITMKVLSTAKAVGESNPLSLLNSSVDERRKLGQPDTTEKELDIVCKNIAFFNRILRLAASIFVDHVINDDYSARIKTHLGLTNKWLDDYFSFKIRRVGRDLLDYDKVCVDLRNQIFAERLAKIASDHPTKEIWFIVGEEHLLGLSSLFTDQYKNINIEVVRRDQKSNFMKAYQANLLTKASSISAPAAAFYQTPTNQSAVQQEEKKDKALDAPRP